MASQESGREYRLLVCYPGDVPWLHERYMLGFAYLDVIFFASHLDQYCQPTRGYSKTSKRGVQGRPSAKGCLSGQHGGQCVLIEVEGVFICFGRPYSLWQIVAGEDLRTLEQGYNSQRWRPFSREVKLCGEDSIQDDTTSGPRTVLRLWSKAHGMSLDRRHMWWKTQLDATAGHDGISEYCLLGQMFKWALCDQGNVCSQVCLQVPRDNSS